MRGAVHLALCLIAVSLGAATLRAQDDRSGQDTLRLVSWVDWLRSPQRDFPDHQVRFPDGSEGFSPVSSAFTFWQGFDSSFDARAVGRLVVKHLESRGVDSPWFGPLEGASAYVVDGRPDAIDEFAKSLDELRQVVRRRVRYRVRLLEPRAGTRFAFRPAGARLEPAELDRLLAVSRVRLDHESTRALGVPLQVGEVRDRGVTADYVTEQAFDAVIADPRVREVFDGPRLECVAHRTSDDDRLRLEVHAVDTKLVSTFRPRPIGVEFLGSFESPVLHRSSLSTTIPIADDEVFVAMVDGPPGRGRSVAWVFEAELLESTVPDSLFEAFPISDLILPRAEPLRASGGLSFWDEEYRFTEEPDFAWIVAQLVRTLSVERVGSELISFGPDPASKVRRFLREGETVRGALLSVSGSVSSAGGDVRFLIPCESGGHFDLRHLSESLYLTDFEVELGMGANGPIPRVDPLYEGLVFGCNFGRRGAEWVQGSILSYLIEYEPREAVSLDGLRLGDIDRLDYTEVPWRDFGPWPLGEWRESKNSVDGLGDVRIRIE